MERKGEGRAAYLMRRGGGRKKGREMICRYHAHYLHIYEMKGSSRSASHGGRAEGGKGTETEKGG